MGNKSSANHYRVVWWGALLLFFVVASYAPRLASGVSNQIARAAIIISPIPFLLLVWGTGIRKMLRTDEFIRKVTLEQAGIAAFITAGWTYAYGFLEQQGYPKLSMFWVPVVMAFVFSTLNLVERYRSNNEEHRS